MTILAKINGIDGASQVSGHEKWIDVLSVSNNVSRFIQRSGRAGDRETSQTEVGDFNTVFGTDASLPHLWALALGGDTVDEILFDFIAGGNEPKTYLQIKLKDAMVSSLSFGADGTNLPTLHIAWNMATLSWNYTGLDQRNQAQAAIRGEYDAVRARLA